MQIYPGTHYVFLNVQFLLSIPLIYLFPPETTIALCFGHFYYQPCVYLWPLLLPLAPRFIAIYFSKLLIFLSIICNAKTLFHDFAAHSAFMFFIRYLLSFLCSCDYFTLSCVPRRTVWDTHRTSVWCEKNPNFVSKHPSVLELIQGAHWGRGLTCYVKHWQILL